MVKWVKRRLRLARGFFRTRTAVARESADAMAAVESAEARAVRAETENRSLVETVKMRDREIEVLRAEKNQLAATVAQREFEIELLNKWLERTRKQIDADIAEQVAREQAALKPKPPRAA